MTSGWALRLERAARGLTPFGLTLLLALFAVLPWPLPGFAAVTPAFTLIAVYFWSIYRPDRLPYAATFAIGFVQDVLSGNPIGITSMVLLIAQGIVVSQRRFFPGKTFIVVWWGFMLIVPGAMLISWSLGSLYSGTLLPPGAFVVQMFLTVLLYPPLTYLFSRAHRHLMSGA